jgi:DNA-binding NarL/FixJ family response regulator
MPPVAADSEAVGKPERQRMAERFERHKQAWTSEEIQKLHTLAKKGMPLRAIAKALTRSEESVKARAKDDKLGIAALR